MDNINEVIDKLQNLKLDQQQLVVKLINEISATNTDTKASASRNTSDCIRNERERNPNFKSTNGVSLAIGDRVRVLSNRKTGKQGDLAKVIKFNRIYVAIELERNQSRTQRASKYLEYISDKK